MKCARREAAPDVSRASLPLTLPQLAARIAVSNLHKNTKKSFSETCVHYPIPPPRNTHSPLNLTRRVSKPL